MPPYPDKKTRPTPSQAGSAIIYVFVGVILFGILGLTFSRSMQQSSGDISEKTAKVGASEIIAYARSIDRAVNKMILNGTSETDIGFSNSVTTLNAGGGAHYLGNANCAVAECEIFDPAGGKVKPRLISSNYVIDNDTLSPAYPMAGAIIPTVIQVDALGSTDADLAISFFGLKMPVCRAINASFNLDNPNNQPPVEDNIPTADYYDGDLTLTTTIVGDTVADFSGKMDFCYKISGSSPEVYVYSHVLIAR